MLPSLLAARPPAGTGVDWLAGKPWLAPRPALAYIALTLLHRQVKEAAGLGSAAPKLLI